MKKKVKGRKKSKGETSDLILAGIKMFCQSSLSATQPLARGWAKSLVNLLIERYNYPPARIHRLKF